MLWGLSFFLFFINLVVIFERVDEFLFLVVYKEVLEVFKVSFFELGSFIFI